MTSSRIIRVTNIAPQATRDQLQTLFQFVGKVEDIKLYPTIRDVSIPVTSRISFVKYVNEDHVAIAQHLNNTVFIDRALIVVPFEEMEIPDEHSSMQSLMQNGGHLAATNDNELPAHVSNVVDGAYYITKDPSFAEHQIPEYPPLPCTMEYGQVEEIRRTVIVGNLAPDTDIQQLMDWMAEAGEVKYARMCGRPTDLTRACLLEFTEQASVMPAIMRTGTMFNGRPLAVTHSGISIIKPQIKTNELAMREIEEAMKRAQEQKSTLSSTIIPQTSYMDDTSSKSRRRSRSRSRSRRHRSRSRGRRRRSRSRSRRRSRSRKRSPGKKRSRSRDKRSSRRSKSRDRKRHRSRSRSRDKKDKDKGSDKSKSSRDKDKEKSSSDSKSRKEEDKSKRSSTDTSKSTKADTNKPLYGDSKTKDPPRSRSRSPPPKKRSRTRSPPPKKRSPSRSRSRQRSRSPRRGGGRSSRVSPPQRRKSRSPSPRRRPASPPPPRRRSRTPPPRRRSRTPPPRRRSPSPRSRRTPPRSSRSRRSPDRKPARSRSRDRDAKRDSKSDRRGKDRRSAPGPRDYDEEEKGFDRRRSSSRDSSPKKPVRDHRGGDDMDISD